MSMSQVDLRRGEAEFAAARRDQRPLLVAAFIFSIFVNALNLSGSLYMLQVYDRVLTTGGLPDPMAPGYTFKSVSGGFLVQSRDDARLIAQDLKVVTKRSPTEAEIRDMLFAFTIAKHVKSNAIVYAKNGATVGIGAGQMSRIDSARMAARKAEDSAKEAKLSAPLTKGSVVASDAFFPFADGLLVAIEAGATAVIQPGGSMRDHEVIEAADAKGLAMVLTGMRHFRH